MDPLSSQSDGSPPDSFSHQQHDQSQKPPLKRTRVVLSCAPCRASKLKCDRGQPCTQCAKKGRLDLCVYAPRPVRKQKPAKGMSARLKRLEGMVRGMMDGEGSIDPESLAVFNEISSASSGPAVKGHVVQGDRSTTYVGATHCMAMLEDIQDLKTYFDDAGDEDGGASPSEELDGSELLLYTRGGPRNREDLLAQIPARHVADRLVTKFFASMSPSQHIIHRPTFTKRYARFWQDPSSASMHWIAQLFLLLAMGTSFNSYSAPHDLQSESPIPVEDRVKHYRSCASWALIWGKYMQPTEDTLPAFLLNLGAYIVFDRATQMPCYIMSGVCIRLMLKMGLHRDPSKLAYMSPYEGEMRRRMWGLANQLDTLVSFHMGLPSMAQTIESDTELPRNLHDDDFDEDIQELPPERPLNEHTLMTYAVFKTKILRAFGKIAHQAHALTPPTFSEVMRLDQILQKTWQEVPTTMQVRPLEDCVGDAPALLIHRFGLAALYNKSRCVLHRRYLAEPMLDPEHHYSRKQCIEGATALLDYQYVIWKACQPGNVLSDYGWFVSSLAVHDFLLAAMIIYMCIQSEHYVEADLDFNWMVSRRLASPTKQELKDMMRRSHFIWSDVSNSLAELRKTADTLAIMLARIGCPVDGSSGTDDSWTSAAELSNGVSTSGSSSHASARSSSAAPNSSSDVLGNGTELFATMALNNGDRPPQPLRDHGYALPTNHDHGKMVPPELGAEQSLFSSLDHSNGDALLADMDFAAAGGPQLGMLDLDPSWMNAAPDSDMDWRFLDTSFAHSHTAGTQSGAGPSWVDRFPIQGAGPFQDMGY